MSLNPREGGSSLLAELAAQTPESRRATIETLAADEYLVLAQAVCHLQDTTETLRSALTTWNEDGVAPALTATVQALHSATAPPMSRPTTTVRRHARRRTNTPAHAERAVLRLAANSAQSLTSSALEVQDSVKTLGPTVDRLTSAISALRTANDQVSAHVKRATDALADGSLPPADRYALQTRRSTLSAAVAGASLAIDSADSLRGHASTILHASVTTANALVRAAGHAAFALLHRARPRHRRTAEALLHSLAAASRPPCDPFHAPQTELPVGAWRALLEVLISRNTMRVQALARACAPVAPGHQVHPAGVATADHGMPLGTKPRDA